eukprot:CAMPEP_0181136200 /NCGR_PEP_ID=MMETSP1071-20121207/33056_1 /TAXON_ID=35127 /ORGANISM="Thalassiosira sp., Strain NH16" /LENGTH=41 /DNA_ID= /DNA_START= /DNA_END= /DNA_ORIENTATION=
MAHCIPSPSAGTGSIGIAGTIPAPRPELLESLGGVGAAYVR